MLDYPIPYGLLESRIPFITESHIETSESTNNNIINNVVVEKNIRQPGSSDNDQKQNADNSVQQHDSLMKSSEKRLEIRPAPENEKSNLPNENDDKTTSPKKSKKKSDNSRAENKEWTLSYLAAMGMKEYDPNKWYKYGAEMKISKNLREKLRFAYGDKIDIQADILIDIARWLRKKKAFHDIGHKAFDNWCMKYVEEVLLRKTEDDVIILDDKKYYVIDPFKKEN
jgi:hypothetical protein